MLISFEYNKDGEVMDPSMDGTSDVPSNENTSKAVESEECSEASSQVIQSEPCDDDEVQSPEFVPKGTVKRQ